LARSAMNDFDQTARYAARRLDDEGFLRWLMGETTWAAWRWAGWLDTQAVPLPGDPDRRADVVAAFERRAGDAPPMAVVIEFMSEARGVTPERLAEYALVLRHGLPYQKDPLVLYELVGIVVNLTGEATTGEWSMAPPDCDGLGLWMKAGVRNLGQISARDTLAAIASGGTSLCVLAWIPLMVGANEVEVVTEWRRLAETEPDLKKRADYGVLALAFARLADHREVWQKGLEGWNMERSPYFIEIEARGEAKGRRAMLLRLLQTRFGTPVPEEVKQAVQAQSDHSILEAWFDRALAAATLDELRKALGLVNGAPEGGGQGTGGNT